MNITFLWNQCSPVCQVSSHDFGFKEDCITNFLTDDEGLDLKYLKDWIKKGLIGVEKVNTGELDYYDMWGQAWGADIRKEGVNIYWGYSDTDYEEFIPFDSFYIILKNWSDFLELGGNKNKIIKFKV